MKEFFLGKEKKSKEARYLVRKRGEELFERIREAAREEEELRIPENKLWIVRWIE